MQIWDLPWWYYPLIYLGIGVLAFALVWLLDKLLLALQGFYDEIPLTLFGASLTVLFWPIALVGRLIMLPFQLWTVYEQRVLYRRH